jgi:hypothetical protein
MTTPTPQLALATAADWSWLHSAARMARLCWQNRPAAQHGPAASDWAANPRAESDPAFGQRTITRVPAAAAHSIGPARTFVLRTMQCWGEATRAGDAAAVASELLANALKHAVPATSETGEPAQSSDQARAPEPSPDSRPSPAPALAPILLGLQHAGPYVVCAVADPSNHAPVLRQPEWLDEGGRGLVVVASLSDIWGHCMAPAGLGKVVWAAFASGADR